MRAGFEPGEVEECRPKSGNSLIVTRAQKFVEQRGHINSEPGDSRCHRAVERPDRQRWTGSPRRRRVDQTGASALIIAECERVHERLVDVAGRKLAVAVELVLHIDGHAPFAELVLDDQVGAHGGVGPSGVVVADDCLQAILRGRFEVRLAVEGFSSKAADEPLEDRVHVQHEGADPCARRIEEVVEGVALQHEQREFVRRTVALVASVVGQRSPVVVSLARWWTARLVEDSCEAKCSEPNAPV